MYCRNISQRHRFVSLRRLVALSLVISSAVAASAPFTVVNAASNDRIISDADLFKGSAMSTVRIQHFLEAKGGALANYSASGLDGTPKRASDIIAEVSQKYDLSPKFFLTLLEKEQSLVTDPTPTQSQLDYALGYGCPSSCSAAYKGFTTQLDAAGNRIKNDYLPALQQNGQFNGWGPGIEKLTIDNILVTPANNATAILYIYNPYVGRYGGGDPRWGANSLFQLLWQKWFVRRHPDGSLLVVRGTSSIWLIRNGLRSEFVSKAAFYANYDAAKLITVDSDEIESYDVGPSIRFPEPSLIMVKSTKGVYLLSNGQKRPIASTKAFKAIGYNWEEVIRNVNPNDLSEYPTGPSITEADAGSSGKLLKSKKTGGITYVDGDGTRHGIFSRQILLSQFRGLKAQPVPDEQITAYPIGDPVRFRDGELIATKSEGKIYFVSNGRRRPVPDIETFKQLGFKMKNVIWTNEQSVNAQPLGDPLSDINAQP